MRGRTLLYLTTFVIATVALGNGYNGFNGGSLLSILTTFHEHVCDGGVLKLRCPRNTLISMQFAQYGRQVPSSRMCPAPVSNGRSSYRSLYTPYHYLREDTNCQATTSLTVLLDLCQNKHRCHLVASAETFRQDPCPGTSKYLEVAYKCRPDTYKNEVACEGDQVELWCHRATRIAVYAAFFGQTPNGSSQCLQTHHDYIDCRARDALDEVRHRCHGRKQCVLEAEEYVFGNPCPSDVNKYLNVTYTCVPKRILKVVHRKEKGHKRRKKKKKKKKGKHRKEEVKDIDSISTEVSRSKLIPATTRGYDVHNPVTQEPEKASADAAGAILHEGNTIVPPKKPDDVPDSIIHRNSGNRDPGTDNQERGDTVTKSDVVPTVTVHTSLHAITATTATTDTNNNVHYSEVDGSPPVKNITVVCVNYTTVHLGGSKQSSMGFLKDWFNTVHFLARNREKAILYLVLGVCAGIITLLSVALAKIGIDYKRNVKAKLDVTEPTHSHPATNNHHHNPLEGPSLEHADSLDRIEVVRFSPRGTLRSDHGSRSLSNYYG